MPSKWMKDFLAKKYEDHRKRVREAKTTLDKQKPPAMPMSMRREMERKRIQSAIEQDNRLLMDRLGDAMSHKNIDNELKAKPFVSYIELQRKKDMVRVTRENRRLLERIQTTNPSYNHAQWEQDAEKRMEYLRTMTQFPDYFEPPGVHRPGFKTTKTLAREGREARILMLEQSGMDSLAAEMEALGLTMPAPGLVPLSPPLPEAIMGQSHQEERPGRPFALPPIDR